MRIGASAPFLFCLNVVKTVKSAKTELMCECSEELYEVC